VLLAGALIIAHLILHRLAHFASGHPIDDGVDIDHENFRFAGKIVAPRDVTRKTNDPLPSDLNNQDTVCAGVACASGASGVVPKARLMPIRLVSALGSQNEAKAFVWATQNGTT
jgi:subtilisin family serine protease